SKALCVLFVLSLFFIAGISFASTSNISNLVFTTDSQTIKPGDVSKEIIVQTQNSSGAAEKVDETNDTTFTSNSPTGQFLNSSGNPVSTTMSKNTSSRTFYYKDNTEGTHTLTISIKGRDTGKTFSATQQIIISSNVPIEDPSSGTSTSTATSTDLTSTSTSNAYSGSVLYSYSSGTPLSQFSEDDFDLKIYAGRDRVSFINSPVRFNAQVRTKGSLGNLNYSWSFGDGSSSSNKMSDHYYIYPGTYNVVLNVSNGVSDVVSVSKVEVLEPKVSFSFHKDISSSFAQISNDSSQEANLAGYKILYGTKEFVIPQDTILSANSNIKIPLLVLDQEKISLTYPNGTGLAEAISDTEKNARIAEISSKLSIIGNKIAEIRRSTDPVKFIGNKDITEDKQTKNIEDEAYVDDVEDRGIQDEKVEDIQNKGSVSQVGGSFFDTLLATPKKIFDLIKW
ncbi:MAG: PKD domain-containing protein, partial [bacterium]